MSIVTRENTMKSRDLMVQDAEGNVRQAVALSGGVQPGRSWSVSVTIADEELAMANAEELGTALDGFIHEIRAQALSSGMPVA